MQIENHYPQHHKDEVYALLRDSGYHIDSITENFKTGTTIVDLRQPTRDQFQSQYAHVDCDRRGDFIISLNCTIGKVETAERAEELIAEFIEAHLLLAQIEGILKRAYKEDIETFLNSRGRDKEGKDKNNDLEQTPQK